MRGNILIYNYFLSSKGGGFRLLSLARLTLLDDE